MVNRGRFDTRTAWERFVKARGANCMSLKFDDIVTGALNIHFHDDYLRLEGTAWSFHNAVACMNAN